MRLILLLDHVVQVRLLPQPHDRGEATAGDPLEVIENMAQC